MPGRLRQATRVPLSFAAAVTRESAFVRTVQGMRRAAGYRPDYRACSPATRQNILAFQRIAGNAHELDALNAELRKIQARLSATEDDDELDALIAERKAIKARIEGFAIVPDDFDYAPTGQTVAQMWNDGDDTVKRGMVRAVKESWGMILKNHEGQWTNRHGDGRRKEAGTRTESWTLAMACASGARSSPRDSTRNERGSPGEIPGEPLLFAVIRRTVGVRE